MSINMLQTVESVHPIIQKNLKYKISKCAKCICEIVKRTDTNLDVSFSQHLE